LIGEILLDRPWTGKFVVVRKKKNPVQDIFILPDRPCPEYFDHRKSYLGNQSVRLFLFLCDSTCRLEMIFLFTEKLYTPFFPTSITTTPP